jgi:hypothetical protein
LKTLPKPGNKGVAGDSQNDDPMISKNTLINLAELEELVDTIAWTRLTSGPHHTSTTTAAGPADELTLKRNCQAFAESCQSGRACWLMSAPETCRYLSLSQEIEMPIVIAPTAFQALAHSQGELATAAAAKRLNTVMTLSTLSNHEHRRSSRSWATTCGINYTFTKIAPLRKI